MLVMLLLLLLLQMTGWQLLAMAEQSLGSTAEDCKEASVRGNNTAEMI